MNKSKLKREGQTWVDENIISEEQLNKILALYTKKDPNFILILFAILLTGLGFLTFIFSDWAQVPHYSRIIIVLLAMVGLYIVGDLLYRKNSVLYGVSFILLGYVVFGAGLFLTIDIYNIMLFSAWPLVICSFIGLLLYAFYGHRLLFTIGIIVITIGQIYSGVSFHTFDWFIFLIFLIGYAHFTYHRANGLYGYLFGISYSIQMLVLVLAESQQYYWLIIGYLVLYLFSYFVPKKPLQQSFKFVSLLSIFLFGMFRTFLLQEDFFIGKIEIQMSFFITWILLIFIVVLITLYKDQKVELINLILFLPVFVLPFSYIFGLISLFVFALVWLIVGYQTEDGEKILIGTTAFLLTTFIVYIQFAWDAINKSLFFLIGGLLLFLISYSFERQRRKLLENRKGGAKK